jgi:UDP-glucose 4-epimerase
MILVTGAAGRLGSRVLQLLVERGVEVVGTDQRPAPPGFPAPFHELDLCDRQQTRSLVADADAVLHMGAIPGPGSQPPERIFDNNVVGTFNVLWAAQEHGLRRVVFSSSAFGMGWAPDPSAFVPLYLPLDEAHPMMPFEPYGLSKLVGEQIGQMVARSSHTTVVSLRFTNVVGHERHHEFPWPAPTREEPLTLVMWAHADPRDVAEAHVRALDADIDGHEAFMLAQPTTRFAEPTVDLVRSNFGDAVEIRDGLDGNRSVISTCKARDLLGFQPQLDWR